MGVIFHSGRLQMITQSHLPRPLISYLQPPLQTPNSSDYPGYFHQELEVEDVTVAHPNNWVLPSSTPISSISDPPLSSKSVSSLLIIIK